VGDHGAQHRLQVVDGIGPKRPGGARDRDVELLRIDQELDAETGVEAFEPPHPVQLLLLFVRLLSLKTRRDEAGNGRERECARECARGWASGGNAVLRK
jgi:hypothetical protein